MYSIYALATARGKAGVAIIRVSGDRSLLAATRLGVEGLEPRKTSLRRLSSGAGVFLDEAVVIYFPEGSSFTGEDVVEFQLHGSPAIVAATLDELSHVSGLRQAEPGEFTRRALENGRLDLAQVEGLADLIDAETEAQRIQALRVFDGELGERVRNWRSDLVRAAALLEATIDFADEDVPVDVTPEVSVLLNGVEASLKEQRDGANLAERIRDGFEVAILGPPNIGKSTLLNALAGRDAAITSSVAGTTRDIIEVRMDLRGLPVTFLDTAGLRETSDEVEEIGIARALERADRADLRIFLTETGSPPVGVDLREDDILLLGKGDLGDGDVSGLTGKGVAELTVRVAELLELRSGDGSLVIRQRHREAIERCMEALQNARDELRHGIERSEIAAEEIRSAIIALEVMVGQIDVEAVLDEIFASFCLGK